jgi:membrane-bound serine protease (ClpP class)
VALAAALLLAVFVLPSPWGVVALGVGLSLELGEAWFWWRLSRRRRPVVGVEALVGARATVVTACRPQGHVRVAGELWQARCDAGADPGDAVRVVSVNGLELVVAPT